MRSIISSLFSRLKKTKTKYSVKPLITHTYDMAVVRRVRQTSIPNTKQFKYIKKILSPQEKRVIRVAAWLCLVGIFWLGYSVRAVYRQEVPTVGGTYVEAVVGEPKLINPLFASVNDVDMDISRLVFSGLMQYSEEQQLVPDLAATYSLSDDKKTYRFNLREDVVWHDGQPFTARDVAFTFELIQDPAVASPLLVGFQGVTITVIDDYTIEFLLAEPFQPFLSSLTVGILPEHIWEDVTPDRLRLAQDNLRPVGTGPFVFHKLAKDDSGFIFRYELQRFESYYETPPYIEFFIFQFFGEYETDLGAIQALRQKKVDGLHFVPAQLKDMVERKHITIHTLQLPQYTALFFNQKKQPLLEKVDVRKALAYALDKERILRESVKGEGKVIYSPILAGFPGYRDTIEKTPYSPEQSNTLLDPIFPRVSGEDYRSELKKGIVERLKTEYIAAKTLEAATPSSTVDTTSTPAIVIDISSSTENSFSALADTELDNTLNSAQTFYRKDANGKIISLRLVTADTAEYRQAASMIAGFWQDLGIQTTIDFVAIKDFSRQVLKERNYDVVLYGVIVGSDPDQYPFWHSSQKDYPGLNLSLYVNRSLDEVLQKARETDDEATLAELYGTFQDTIIKDIPAVFLYTPIYRYATSDHIQGVMVERIFHPADRFAGVRSWYIKTVGDWQWKNKESAPETEISESSSESVENTETTTSTP